MTKLEKVIKGLECCLVGPLCSQCPYENVCDSLEVVMTGALELLKEQEPTKPIRNLGITRCGNCNREIDKYEGVKYCPNCGKAVKWDDKNLL